MSEARATHTGVVGNCLALTALVWNMRLCLVILFLNLQLFVDSVLDSATSL